MRWNAFPVAIAVIVVSSSGCAMAQVDTSMYRQTPQQQPSMLDQVGRIQQLQLQQQQLEMGRMQIEQKRLQLEQQRLEAQQADPEYRRQTEFERKQAEAYKKRRPKAPLPLTPVR